MAAKRKAARGKPLRSIVVATDFSPHAARAARRAARLARGLRARVGLFHVIDASPLARVGQALGLRGSREACVQASRRKLAAALAPLRRIAGARATARLAVGDVRKEILRAARASDLLVIGVRGLNPLRDVLMGTTAERLLQTGRRPMLIVKQSAAHAYRRVVVAFDFSPDALAALHTALSIAPGARITLVHAFEVEFAGMLWRGMVPQAQLQQLRTDARTDALLKMHRVVSKLGDHARRIDLVVGRGYAPRVVLDAAQRRGADLIAVGKQGRTGLERLLIGSLTRHVLADAECDVLVARR